MPDDTVVSLPLSDISFLFNAPRIEPMSSCPPEVLGVSGITYLFNYLHLDKSRQRARTLVLTLPMEKITPALAEQATQAIRRHTELNITQALQELRNTYCYGWRVTVVAVFLLAICLGLSSLFSSEMTEWMGPLTRKTFDYGIEIIGWVILWHPVDLLGFTPLAIRARITTLRTIASLDVVVRADDVAVA